MSILTPNYLSMDFETLKTDIISALEKTEVFKDYNFEGSNISVLIELIAYLGDVNTYYLNRMAKELYLDTVEIYENAHRLSKLSGYTPLGYRSSSTDLKVSLQQDTAGEYFSLGDELEIIQFASVSGTAAGNNVSFVVPYTMNTTVDLSFVDSGLEDDLLLFEWDVLIKQGTGITYEYVGSDVANNKIQLPFFNFDHTQVTINTEESVWLLVNNDAWTRVDSFFEEISGIENEYNLFKLVYDKYKNYHIEFSASLNQPNIEDDITIKLIKTEGEDGNVGAGVITTIDDDQFIYNVTKGIWIPNDNITIINNRASDGGESFEDVNTLKNNALAFAHSQFRCTTKKDYKNYLEKKTEIVKATAWGQQELKYQSDTRDYNKIYMSFIPASWGLSVIDSSSTTWTLDNGKESTIIVPNQYLSSFTQELELYLEPYKMMNIYHSYELPDLVYFAIDGLITPYSNYTYANVLADIKNKLDYIFRSSNMDFGETIDFREIEKQIVDTTIVSPTDDFTNIKGIKYFKIRDIHVNKDIYDLNNEQNFPQYGSILTEVYGSTSIENNLNVIKLGPGQFPMFDSTVCEFKKE